MRLHRLAVEGIGPYADRQELDFDELTAQGLFLLTGPTGAGKTTVLDAIVFALYGTVPGARGGDGKRERRARERIVSDLRDVNTKPEVELEFTVAGRRLLVRRSPDHTRPKTRGEGLTVAKASASLEEFVDGMWVPRSTDFYEISTELQDLLGMNADQFAQVVLLPQGEFAGFLRASEKDRREVLEKLFRVDHYKSVEHWLRERAEEAKATLADAADRLDGIVDRLAGAMGATPDEDGVPPPGATTEEVARWVEEQRALAASGAAEAVAALETAGNAFADADAAHGRLVAVGELETALRSREDALATHAARMPKATTWLASVAGSEIAGDEDRWAPAAREARARAGLLEDRVADEARCSSMSAQAEAADATAERAEAEVQAADAATAEALRELEAARQAVSSSGRDEEALGALTRERPSLAGRLAAAEALERLERQQAATQASIAVARRARADAEAALAAQPAEAELDAQAEELGAARSQAAERRAVHDGALAQLAQDHAALTQDEATRDHLEAERQSLTARRDDARRAHQDARDAHLTAREARLDAMAAELAGGLEDGAPCPVCGSADHPAPATPSGPQDLRAAEADAARAAAAAEHALAAAEQALAICTGRLEPLGTEALARRAAALADRRAELDRSAAELAPADAELRERTQHLQAAVQARRAAVIAVEERRTAERDAEQQATHVAESIAAARATAGGITPDAARRELAQLDAELARLGELVRGAAAARDRVTALEARVEQERGRSAAARTTAAEQRQRAAGLREEGARLTSELVKLRGSHPSVQAAAAAAAVYAHQIEKAAELLADYRSALRERDQAAAALEARAAAEPPAPGEPTALSERIALRERRRADAHDAASAANAALAEARRRTQALDLAEAALADLSERLGPAAVAAERVIRLDATVRGAGDNVRRISLATYVLAARLEQVADAASTHLLRMSSGRYELVHHDDRYGGGQAGLGLRVRDGWTGEERDTATLSGGEAFYASLALALGLAEVVTGEAGGRPLDTLLVDEGFGSLDPDTLEDVLDELDELRAGGRAIGLVSHVETLSERIPAQLRVTPGRAGSTAQVVTAAA